MTDQQFKDDCDVNFIVDKFTKTGHLTHLAKFQGMYADVSFVLIKAAFNILLKIIKASTGK